MKNKIQSYKTVVEDWEFKFKFGHSPKGLLPCLLDFGKGQINSESYGFMKS